MSDLTHQPSDDPRSQGTGDSALPSQRHVSVLFAHSTPAGFRHFYPSEVAVRLCGDTDPIVRVRVEADPAGDYFAWWANDAARFVHVYHRQHLVEVCFPYGTKAAEERGQGILLRVRVSADARPSGAPANQ